MMYDFFFIAWHILGFIFLIISIVNKNPIGKAFYLLCFFLSNIAALLCDILIKLNF
ncbi:MULTISPECIES: group-specific protein [Brachyspira]|uniref:group-specific protein n=1 Tax=Brachyspira TaxID=29521 RepID=UPI0026EB7FD3|nr:MULTISPECIES: group-specific protein [Brachyspira]WPC23051.1 group-specific protein [Brachyspira hyodysenteriae]WPC23630.1 group-specific protein [Brachyspira hyodysenteriae]